MAEGYEMSTKTITINPITRLEGHGTMPDDIHLFVRTATDVPATMKDETMKIFEEKNEERDHNSKPYAPIKIDQKENGVSTVIKSQKNRVEEV